MSIGFIKKIVSKRYGDKIVRASMWICSCVLILAKNVAVLFLFSVI
jgi:hypothetical protein